MDVARVLIDEANFDVNMPMVVDGGRRVPLFQWAVYRVAQRDDIALKLLLDRADMSLIVDLA